MTPDLHAAAIDLLRSMSAAELRALFHEARIADGWTFYDDEGSPVYDDDEALGGDAADEGYLGSYGNIGSCGRVSRMGRGRAAYWIGLAHDGVNSMVALGERYATRDEAIEAVEVAVVATGWRLPWR